MSSWKVELFPDSKDDYDGLDGSQKLLVKKAIRKLETNPLPRSKGGYGQELGNKMSYNLAGLLKIKLRGAGLRIIYDLIEDHGKAYVIVISVRADERAYKLAAQRIEQYEVWLNSLGLVSGGLSKPRE